MSEIPEPRANPNAQFLAGDVSHRARVTSRAWAEASWCRSPSHIGGVPALHLRHRAHAGSGTERRAAGAAADRHHLVERPRARRRRWWRRQQVAGSAEESRAAGQGKDHRPGREAADARRRNRRRTCRSRRPQLNIPAVTTSAGVRGDCRARSPACRRSRRRAAASAAARAPAPAPASARAGLGPRARQRRRHRRRSLPARQRRGDADRRLNEVKPSYTADAMRQKIQGIVMVEAVVMPDGSVGQVQVVRSLDADLRSRSGSASRPCAAGASVPGRASVSRSRSSSKSS